MIYEVVLIAESEAQKLLGNSVLDVLHKICQDGNVKLVTHLNSPGDTGASCSTNCDGESSLKRAKLFSFNSFHEELV